jgi:hypothetical protein
MQFTAATLALLGPVLPPPSPPGTSIKKSSALAFSIDTIGSRIHGESLGRRLLDGRATCDIVS